ncbi:type I-E CRISPR-associated protein Cas6/Cse3/CasE [Streptomyces sp. SL13]|uniref:Type I-E CRISPR-associated protein Cas6/Cse3/CasE n=1 Tax=Streptantibioticus silvisoli TaxID=2705255 RepID=A0AA90H122_9ACTN|nr:type I-E CRISPR-associated protein Cas6/Cse3/CasE [Streptantibioticus silvisoli]MDI5968605.1 type I-E CRISPR-associated protein Cas6/Cse3/CasE [Streptantibioticus silvisoli]
MYCRAATPVAPVDTESKATTNSWTAPASADHGPPPLGRGARHEELLTLLVQTRVTPDTGRLPTGYAEAHTRDMTPLLTALRPGLPVRYRFLGNCVRRCGRNSTAGAWKQAIPLYDEDAVQWWADRAPTAGLTLHSLLANPGEPLTAYHPVDPTPADRKPAKTPGKKDKTARVPYAATLFEGVATVSEPSALRDALLTGVGRGKSYGCGLLSLAPAPHAG